MHLLNKLRTSFRRKPNERQLTLSEQIETLFKESNRFVEDHRLKLLLHVYEYRLRQFNSLDISFEDFKRIEFERSILKSLRAITSNLPAKPSHLYKTMPTATSRNMS
ncbi:unnamed protein product [Rotaria socialis]|uniref:Uncharacterized protein n=1 Tax=Rotaria socialis TaxID=392032 RepID=A0A817ZE81_9BILA|nr:unnamed protein product [Rotaria socialis]CAF4524355.1 unnamed protein product [Rotaria socialis]